MPISVVKACLRDIPYIRLFGWMIIARVIEEDRVERLPMLICMNGALDRKIYIAYFEFELVIIALILF